MERYGGWVKRQVVKNRKRPTEALNNRIMVQEQVSTLVWFADSQGFLLIRRLPIDESGSNFHRAAGKIEGLDGECYKLLPRLVDDFDPGS